MSDKVKPYEPYAVDFQEAFIKAIEELGMPYPSYQFPNWPMWNQLTGGLRPFEFSILCGPTGCGKTTLLANFSQQLVLAGVKHFVMSVETGYTDYVKRWISVMMGKDVNQGDAVSAVDLQQISARCMPHVKKRLINFSLYDDRISKEKLIQDLQFQASQGCKVAMLDNLNFFLDGGTDNEIFRAMDDVVHSLIILAKKIPMHLILVMHPKKTEGGRVEHEFDIKGPSTAVQEAHNVFLFNRPKKPEKGEPGTYNDFERELKIAKMRRRGQYVGMKLIFSCEETKYTELKYVKS